MEFERAIDEASTLLLFDRRSQQQLQEMVETAQPRSHDWYLIRLTQAAFAYYNAVDAQVWNIKGAITQAQRLLHEIKRFRKDRVFYTMALRLEVDLMLHLSTLHFEDGDKATAMQRLYNEEDEHALSICDTLLKNLPLILDPLPNAWYTSLIPLFPPFRDQVLNFYQDRIKENRVVVLSAVLRQIRQELVAASGVIQAKRYLADHTTKLSSPDKIRALLHTHVKEVGARLDNVMPSAISISADVSLPKGITMPMLEGALADMTRQIEEARSRKDMKGYTASILQQGILHFLSNHEADSVQSLVQTLQASAHIEPSDKKYRQFRHEEFSDIPFMIGTCYLRHSRSSKHDSPEQKSQLEKGVTGLLRAVQLEPNYHHAYSNLILSLDLLEDAGAGAIERLYLDSFGGDFTQINGTVYRNKAFMEYAKNANTPVPEVYKWLIISRFCLGGEQTHAKKMLQELKTLYLLNAHDFSASYINAYRSALRVRDEEFIADLGDDELHSAILFYIAHAFGSLSLQPGKDDDDLNLNYVNLDRAIELNADSMYFNNGNSSSRRLVETLGEIIEYSLSLSEKRWENINNTIGQRFQFYEDYLRQMKSYNLLKERLSTLGVENLLPELTVSETARLKMDGTITSDQRDRLRQRVEMT